MGFDEAIANGAAIVEWPERAPELLPESRIEIELAETADPATRRVTVRGLGSAGASVARIDELMAFLDDQVRWRGARIAYLQGDASTRSYARLSDDDRHGAADGCADPARRPADPRRRSPTAASPASPRTWCARSWPSAPCCGMPA